VLLFLKYFYFFISQLDIGHAAAIEEQSAIALGYIENFMFKIEPFIASSWMDQFNSE
jgi:hypothetical protein